MLQANLGYIVEGRKMEERFKRQGQKEEKTEEEERGLLTYSRC